MKIIKTIIIDAIALMPIFVVLWFRFGISIFNISFIDCLLLGAVLGWFGGIKRWSTND